MNSAFNVVDHWHKSPYDVGVPYRVTPDSATTPGSKKATRSNGEIKFAVEPLLYARRFEQGKILVQIEPLNIEPHTISISSEWLTPQVLAREERIKEKRLRHETVPVSEKVQNNAQSKESIEPPIKRKKLSIEKSEIKAHPLPSPIPLSLASPLPSLLPPPLPLPLPIPPPLPSIPVPLAAAPVKTPEPIIPTLPKVTLPAPSQNQSDTVLVRLTTGQVVLVQREYLTKLKQQPTTTTVPGQSQVTTQNLITNNAVVSSSGTTVATPQQRIIYTSNVPTTPMQHIVNSTSSVAKSSPQLIYTTNSVTKSSPQLIYTTNSVTKPSPQLIYTTNSVTKPSPQLIYTTNSVTKPSPQIVYTSTSNGNPSQHIVYTSKAMTNSSQQLVYSSNSVITPTQQLVYTSAVGKPTQRIVYTTNSSGKSTPRLVYSSNNPQIVYASNNLAKTKVDSATLPVNSTVSHLKPAATPSSNQHQLIQTTTPFDQTGVFRQFIDSSGKNGKTVRYIKVSSFQGQPNHTNLTIVPAGRNATSTQCVRGQTLQGSSGQTFIPVSGNSTIVKGSSGQTFIQSLGGQTLVPVSSSSTLMSGSKGQTLLQTTNGQTLLPLTGNPATAGSSLSDQLLKIQQMPQTIQVGSNQIKLQSNQVIMPRMPVQGNHRTVLLPAQGLQPTQLRPGTNFILSKNVSPGTPGMSVINNQGPMKICLIPSTRRADGTTQSPGTSTPGIFIMNPTSNMRQLNFEDVLKAISQQNAASTGIVSTQQPQLAGQQVSIASPGQQQQQQQQNVLINGHVSVPPKILSPDTNGLVQSKVS